MIQNFGGITGRSNGYWVAGTKDGRMYDVLPDGSALLLMPAETFGRELRLVFRFNEVIRRKLAGSR